jgi:hypothetical protein
LEEATSTAITSLAKTILYGTQVIVQLRLDYLIRKMTKIAQSDVTVTSPFLTTTRAGYEASCKDIYIHPMSYILARAYTTLIQLSGPERRSGKLGSYFCPCAKSYSQATLDALLASLQAEMAGANLANILGTPFRPLPLREIRNVDVVGLFSAMGWLISIFLPCRDDAGFSGDAFNETTPTNIWWHQAMGVPEELPLACMYRDTSAAGTPGFVTTVAAAANKINISYCKWDGTAWVPAPDNEITWDFFRNVATRRGTTVTGPFTTDANPRNVYHASGFTSTAAWTAALIEYCADRWNGVYEKSIAPVDVVLEDDVAIEAVDGSYCTIRYNTEDDPKDNDPINRAEVARMVKGG